MTGVWDFIVNVVLVYVGYAFALVGFAGTVYKAYSNWKNMKVISWDESKKYLKILLKRIETDRFVPDYIVGIGRSGAIVGALISGNMQDNDKPANVPIIACDRFFRWGENGREEIDDEIIDFSPLKGCKVLLVCGDVSTGGTIKFYRKKIAAVQPAELKTAVMIKVKSATFEPDYFGKELTTGFQFPWVIEKDNYKHDGRVEKKDKENNKEIFVE